MLVLLRSLSAELLNYLEVFILRLQKISYLNFYRLLCLGESFKDVASAVYLFYFDSWLSLKKTVFQQQDFC